MKRLVLIFLMNTLAYSQTINFQACPYLFDTNSFVFNKSNIDGTGRNVYQTTPIDGAQSCSGLGICEFQISWNNTNSRWELIADDGTGDFSNPYLIYYNVAASLPNPPSLNLGIWKENTAVTSGGCGGDLTSGNSVLTGAVQNTTLGIESWQSNKLLLLTNPVKDELGLLSPVSENAYLYDIQGRLIATLTIQKGKNNINVTAIKPGIYILKTTEGALKIIKN